MHRLGCGGLYNVGNHSRANSECVQAGWDKEDPNLKVTASLPSAEAFLPACITRVLVFLVDAATPVGGMAGERGRGSIVGAHGSDRTTAEVL